MFKRILFIGLAAVIGGGVATVQRLISDPAPQLSINKVKDDLYNIEGDGGNVAVFVTNEGVILVDDKYDHDHDALLAQIRSVTTQPVRYIINTHYHADHASGNARFLPVAEIISTANARTNILEHKQPNAPPGAAPARVVFTDETAVFLGGKEVRARYFGRGHTNGDAIIYFPEQRTIHTGDLMPGTTPLVDYNGGGSIVEWTKTLDAVMKLDFDTVIPGHGPVTDKAGLLTFRNNVEKLRNGVAGLIRQGKGAEDVRHFLSADYGWAPDSTNMQWDVPGFMTELKPTRTE
ncbi:MAG TPA: MBL fold metallo-hydrolase [Terriglobia bacterium]|nr:MBL fold metallo-hydrolase [Terriglobia bacterium]